MKNLYTTPELNIDILTERDAMTASGEQSGGGDVVSPVRENIYSLFRSLLD